MSSPLTTTKHNIRLVSSRPSSEPAPTGDADAAVDSAALVARVLAGDASAALAIYREHAPNVRRLIWQLLGPDPELEDVVQQVFLAVADALPRLTDPRALGSWIVGITIRTARREIRRRQRWRRHRELEPRDNPAAAGPASAPDQHRVARIFAILDTLDLAERVAFVLRYAEGYRLGEIAEACKCSLATVKRRIARARRQVHEQAREDFWLAPLLQEDDHG